MKLLHISDWHCDASKAACRISQIPDQANFGLIAVTGDMLYDAPAEEQRREWLEITRSLRIRWPKVPIVAVAGNHDVCSYKAPGVKVIEKGAKSFKVAGIKVTGLHIPVVQSKNANVLPPVEWIQTQIGKMDQTAKLVLCHYPPEYLPGLCYWLDNGPWAVAYLNGHYHSDFGVSVGQESRITFSNASQGYTVIDVY